MDEPLSRRYDDDGRRSDGERGYSYAGLLAKRQRFGRRCGQGARSGRAPECVRLAKCLPGWAETGPHSAHTYEPTAQMVFRPRSDSRFPD